MSPIRLKRAGSAEPLSETAADWLLRVEEGNLSTSQERGFQQWLSVPEHARAYDDALWGLDALQRHAAEPELMALREAALARPPERKAQSSWAMGLAAIAAAFIGLFLWTGRGLDLPLNPPATEIAANGNSSTLEGAGLYRTGIGERSAVVLPDGSVATLDTDSQLKVAYSKSERGVYLLRGQALFEVAKNKVRPFQVHAAGQLITAVGTTFNVRVRGDRVQVSMVEGVVRVRPTEPKAGAGAPVQELTLRAGESLVADASQPSLIQPIDTSQIATWRGGLLVFEDEKLSDAVAEINRYTNKPIKLADASLGQYRVTGVFKTNDTSHFAEAMSEVFPVEVVQDAEGTPMLKARE
jgi:transmembrane sensor